MSRGRPTAISAQQIADGTMPQDADPLTAEQIALVNKWVQLAAQLDVGVEPTAALIRVIPKFTQPAAREAYPVPVSVAAVAISPDGKLLATGGYHELLLWDMEQGTIVRRIGNVAERVHHIVFHRRQPADRHRRGDAGTGWRGESLPDRRRQAPSRSS